MAEQPQHEVTTAHTIRAERFELVDAAGAVRATLATDQDGQVAVILFDQDSQRRAALVATAPELGFTSSPHRVRPHSSSPRPLVWRSSLSMTRPAAQASS